MVAQGENPQNKPVSVITMIRFITLLQSNINPYMLGQRKWLFLSKPPGDNPRAGVYAGSSAKSPLGARAERGGQEVIKHEKPSEIKQNMPNTGNPTPKPCSFSCLSQDISQCSGFHQAQTRALLDDWDWEEGLMSLVLTVQPYSDWQ